jgi:hypothetical protein
MYRPAKRAKTDKPNNGRAHKEEQSRKHATLNQLPETWKKEAANSSDHITSRSLVFVHKKISSLWAGFASDSRAAGHQVFT